MFAIKTMAYFIHGRICYINRLKIRRPVFSVLIARDVGFQLKSESSSLFASKAVFSFPKDTNLEEK